MGIYPQCLGLKLLKKKVEDTIHTMSDSKKPKKIDYLEVDTPIAGQNYVCMSFISPESLMQNKETFKCAKFLQSYCKEQNLKFNEVYSKYNDFCYKYEDKLQRDFDEQNDFQTSLRGIKVRGVFDTREAAQARAKNLSNTDSSFHVFIGQVGYWLPWEPNPDKVEDEHFQNTQLNNMMEKYQENNVNRDIFYEDQKRDKIKAAHEEVRLAKESQDKEKKEKLDDISEYEMDKDFEPEPEKEKEQDKDPVPESDTFGETYEDIDPPQSSQNQVEEGIKSSLESDDPWIQRKKEEHQ